HPETPPAPRARTAAAWAGPALSARVARAVGRASASVAAGSGATLRPLEPLSPALHGQAWTRGRAQQPTPSPDQGALTGLPTPAATAAGGRRPRRRVRAPLAAVHPRSCRDE